MQCCLFIYYLETWYAIVFIGPDNRAGENSLVNVVLFIKSPNAKGPHNPQAAHVHPSPLRRLSSARGKKTTEENQINLNK